MLASNEEFNHLGSHIFSGKPSLIFCISHL